MSRRVLYKYPIYGQGGYTVHAKGANPVVRSFRYQPMSFFGGNHNPEPWVVYIEHDEPVSSHPGTPVWVYAAHTGEPLPDFVHDKSTRFIDTASASNGYTLYLYAQVMS